MPKTVFITGSATGIGRACALRFAGAGWRVLAHYHRSRDAALDLQKLLRDAGADCRIFGADLSDRQQTSDLFSHLESEGEEPDVLINNAGLAQSKLFCEITDEDWERMLSVNLSAAFYCTRAVLPAMIRRKSGAIINISSIWGITGASCEVHYSAAKAGLIGMTKALAKEMGPSGIRVNCIAPGVIDTPMLQELDEAALRELRDSTPLGRIGTAEEIAAAALFLAGEDSSFITGQVLSPNGGFVI